MKEESKELKILLKKYEKVCLKLEQLNQDAFELEKAIRYEESKKKE